MNYEDEKMYEFLAELMAKAIMTNIPAENKLKTAVGNFNVRIEYLGVK